MKKLKHIIWQQYQTIVYKKSFILSCIMIPLSLVVLSGLMAYLQMPKEEAELKILLHDDTLLVSKHFRQNKLYHYVVYDTTGKKNYDDALSYFQTHKQYDLLLYLPENIVKKSGSVAKLWFREQPTLRSLTFIEQSINTSIEKIRLSAFNISKRDYAQLKQQTNVHTIDIKTRQKTNIGAKAFIGVALAGCILMFVFGYGSKVMMSVMEEKQNRVIEVILSSVKPHYWVAGKIISMMMVALTQIVAMGLVAVVWSGSLWAVFNPYKASNQVPNPDVQQNIAELQNDVMTVVQSIDWSMLFVSFVLFFVMGYLIYALLFTVVGSFIQNQSEAGKFTLPITAPMSFSMLYFISQIDTLNIDSTGFLVMSYVPFTSPVVMIMRVILDDGVSWLNVFASIGIMIAMFLGCVWLLGKVYKRSILNYTIKPSWQNLWRMLKR